LFADAVEVEVGRLSVLLWRNILNNILKNFKKKVNKRKRFNMTFNNLCTVCSTLFNRDVKKSMIVQL